MIGCTSRTTLRALYRIVSAGRPGETYNVGGDNQQTNLALVQHVCGILDELLPATQNSLAQAARPGLARYEELITFVADRPGHDLRYAIDCTKLKEELGWAPQESFATGFQKTVTWYLENEDWWQSVLSGDYRIPRQGLHQKECGPDTPRL